MIFRLFIPALLLASATTAADIITLADGSRINGEVVSMTNGQYQVRTESLGMISLSKHQIESISSDAAPVAGAGVDSSQLNAIQSTLAGDEGVMSMILQLQADPDMQAVLSDPELMRAVQQFDLDALRSDPRIQKLMQNRKVREINDRVSP